MKIKQISITLILTMCIASIALFMQSCSNEDDYDTGSSALTKVDMFVASEEFQEYVTESRNLGKKFIDNYSQLQDDKKERILLILGDLNKGFKEGDSLSINKYSEFCDIIGINYTEELETLNELKSRVLYLSDMEGVQKKDLMIAYKKYEFVNSTPTLKSGGEGLTESQLRCVESCEAAWLSATFACVCSAVTNPLIGCACEIAATYACAKCVEACK